MREEDFHYYAHNLQGEQVELLHTLDLYSNHSAVPIHIDYFTAKPHAQGSRGRETDFPLQRLTQQLLARMSGSDDAYRIFALLLMRRLLYKYQPLPVLWAGGAAQVWERLLGNILRAFHPASQVYRLNPEESALASASTVWRMPWAHCLLPQKAFELLVIDALTADAAAPVDEHLAQQLLLGLCPYGECIVLVPQAAQTWLTYVQQLLGDESVQVYVSASGSCVGHVQLTPARRQLVAQDTLKFAVEQAQTACQQLVAQAQSLLAQPDWEAGAVLPLAEAVEQYLLWLFPYLHSTTVKYHANEWKRQLIDCELGFGTRTAVQAAFQQFLADFQAE